MITRVTLFALVADVAVAPNKVPVYVPACERVARGAGCNVCSGHAVRPRRGHDAHAKQGLRILLAYDTMSLRDPRQEGILVPHVLPLATVVTSRWCRSSRALSHCFADAESMISLPDVAGQDVQNLQLQ